MKKVISAGGFIFYKNESGEIETVLMENSKGEWWIPKGKIDHGETHDVTALREIYEEVGFPSADLRHVGIVNVDDYVYNDDGIETNKVLYLHAYTANAKLEISPKDLNHKDIGRWLTYDKAVSLISFNCEDLVKAKKMFDMYMQ